MEQLAIIGRLKSGMEQQAAALIARGAPFDPEGVGLRVTRCFSWPKKWFSSSRATRSNGSSTAWWTEPFQWDLLVAFEEWRPLIDGHPRIARAAYSWAEPPKT
jgi:hypothetical protein